MKMGIVKMEITSKAREINKINKLYIIIQIQTPIQIQKNKNLAININNKVTAKEIRLIVINFSGVHMYEEPDG